MVLENNLGEDPVRRLVFRLAVPSMLAQFVSVLYSIVDRMFIGHIEGIGGMALAGVGVAGPIVNLIGSAAFLVGVGGAPLFSIRMGERRQEKAQQILNNAFLMLLVLAVILTGVSLLLKRPLLYWFGASDTIFSYADEYMTVYVLGTVFALLATGMNQFIICQGFAKVAMKSVFLGAVCNILLDPVFIFVFGLGVRGAAAATVLSQFFACAYVLRFLFGRKAPVRIRFGEYAPSVIGNIARVGMTPFLIIAFDNILIIALNTVLQKFGGAGQGDWMVTCGTIVQSFMLMITMPLGGITGGTQAILGFNYGAGRPDRIREAQKWILLLGSVLCSIFFLLAWLVPEVFVRLFTTEPDYLEFCSWAIGIYTLGVIPLAFQYTIVDGFTGMGKIKPALALSFFRKGLYFVCIVLFPAFWGVQATFFAEPVVDIISGVLSAVVYVKIINRVIGIEERKKAFDN